MAARNSDLYKKVLTFAWEYYTASQSQREQLIQRYGVQAKEYALFIASKDPIRYQTNNLRDKITVKTLNEIFRVFYSKDKGSRSDYEILQLSLNKGLDYLNSEDEQVFERIEKTEDPEQKAKEIEKKIQEKTEKKYKIDSAEVTKITPKKPNEKPSIKPVVTSPIKNIQPIPTPSIIKKLTAFFNPQPTKPPQAIPLPAQPQKVQAIKKQSQKTFTQMLPVFTRDTLNFLKPVGLDALSKAKIQTRRIILKNPFEVGSLINGLIWSGIVYSQTGELGTALVTGLVATIAPYAARDILQKRTVGGPGFLESRPKINSDRSNILKNRAAGFISQRISSFTLSNPWVLGTIAVLVIILLLFIFPFLQKGTSYLCPYSGNCLTDNESRQTEKSFEILKSGPVSVENGQKITYQISIKNLSQQALDALVTDIIQRNTKYIESEPAGELSGADENGNGGTITWKLDKVSPSSTKVISLIIEPQENDIWVINQSETTNSFNSKYIGDLTGILPSPLPPPPPNWESIKNTIITAFDKHPELIKMYKEVSSLTSVPWQLLAGLHFVETGGGPGPDSSLVSGRKIGQIEPDVPKSACVAASFEPGQPIPIGGGCGFKNQADSAIYAAKHLSGKIGKVPTTFSETITAMSRYNGGGNSNCDRGLPYNNCPAQFEGEDDPYAINYFDEAHTQMFLVYCADFTKCNPPRRFERAGAITVVRVFSE